MNHARIALLLTGLLAILSAGCAVATNHPDTAGAGAACRGMAFLAVAVLAAIIGGRRSLGSPP
jgi:hypothetical protein